MEENGIIEAVISSESKVRDVWCNPLKGVESFMLDTKELANPEHHIVTIAKSWKLSVYEIDFG